MKPDELGPLSAAMRNLLADEQAAPAMPAAMQAQLASRIAGTIASPALPGGEEAGNVAEVAELSDAATSLSPLASLAAKPALLAATAFAVGVAAGVGGTEVFSNQDALPQPVPVAVIELVDAGIEVLPPPDARLPVAVVVDAAPTTDSRARSKAPLMGRDQALAAERSLIELARTAITRGNADNALANLKRHARKFRRGQLAEERDALWVQALALSPATHAEARVRAEAFKTKYPKSLFRPVVEHILRKMP